MNKAFNAVSFLLCIASDIVFVIQEAHSSKEIVKSSLVGHKIIIRVIALSKIKLRSDMYFMCIFRNP